MKDMTCKRCTLGIDDDGDGNCSICADVTDGKAEAMRKAALVRTTRAMDAGRLGAFDEVEIVLRAMSVSTNPILAVRAHQQRYPGPLDLFNAMHAEEIRRNTTTVPIFNGHVSPLYLTRRGNPKPSSSICENWGEATDQQAYRGPVLEALADKR